MVDGVVVAEAHAAGEELVAEGALHLQVEVVVVHVVVTAGSQVVVVLLLL